jgi:hypothetical protein
MGVRDADRVREGLAGRLRVSETPSVFFRDYELSGVIRQYSPRIVEGDAGLPTKGNLRLSSLATKEPNKSACQRC